MLLSQRLAAVKPYIPWTPEPKQAAFLLLNNLEVLFGGAARGGKSAAMLMAATLYVDIPGYSALLLRRTYADLSRSNALMDVARQWFGPTNAHWNEKTKTWTFPSGARIEFGYLAYENDKYQYQSSSYSMIGFDELTQFLESQYTYLFSRLTRASSGPLSRVPVRMRGATNPGGIGGQWVYDRFVSPESAIERKAHRRLFIQSFLRDNTHVDAEQYIAGMQETSAEDKAALLDGIWTFAKKGVKFDRHWFKKTTDVPVLAKIIRVWDLAGTKPHEDNPDPDWTRGLKIGITSDNEYYLLDLKGMRGSPGEVEKFIRKEAEADGLHVKIYIQQDPGQAGKSQIYNYTKNVLNGYRVFGWPTGGKSKEERADPVSGAAQNGFIHILIAGWNEDLFNEVEVFPQAGYHDDIVDVLADGYNILSQRRETRYERGAEKWLIPA